jgi:16S rRNA (cytosine967-C5)-methyltransferase
MPISPARTAAFDILLQVEREHAYAAELLHSPRYQKLSSADHGLTTEIVMGVLRWRSLLDSELARLSSQKLEKLDVEVLVSLRMAVFQLWLLERVPARAAVHESVELVKRARKRSAGPFVNALLRKLTGYQQWRDDLRRLITESSKADTARSGAAPVVRSVTSPEQRIRHLADRYAHPRWMVEGWSPAFGEDYVRQILRSNQQIPTTAIRLPSPADEAALERSGVVLLNGELLKTAARIESGNLTRTEPFRAGRIAIQDEASQLVALLVGKGSNILDCCAAPGGKTRILAERNPHALIMSAELHPHRARLLRRLVPNKNVRVVAADARHLPLGELFDRVLVDAPCSGTGTLSRNPEIKWRLEPADLTELQSKQLAILQSAMQHLKPSGRLIYSTCSLEHEENQDVVELALTSDSSFRLLDCRGELQRLRSEGELAWQDLDSLLSGPFLRTLPGVHPCDGFFAAILERM